MTRDNLERFQDTYAEKMQKYGLVRGVKGSDARHISTLQYYRELFAENEEQQEVYDKARNLYDRKTKREISFW